MVYSLYKKQRILYYSMMGYKSTTIRDLLAKEGMRASKWGIIKFLKRYKETGTITRKPGSGRPSRITPEIKAIVDGQMKIDDETTAYQLLALLNSRGYPMSISTVLRCRKELGWTFRGSAYCQIIREANKLKRLQFAREYLAESQNPYGFYDVIWTDETTLQLESHRRFACHKKGERPKNKPRYVQCLVV